MALFSANTNTQNTRKRTKDLSPLEQEELAYEYASKSWHDIKGTLEHMKDLDMNEELEQAAMQGLFDYKLGLIAAKKERGFNLQR